MNNCGKSGYPCLVPALRGNALRFSPPRMTVAVGLSYIHGLYYVEVCSLYAQFLGNFYQKLVLVFVKSFFPSFIEMIIGFLFFNSLMQCIALIDLWILKNPCIPRINLI